MRKSFSSSYRHLAGAGLITLSVALSSCATLNMSPKATALDVDVPTAPNAEWVEAAPKDMPDNDWLGTFNDPVLVTLVDEALEKNPDVRAAKAVYDAATARTTISNADRLPTLSGSLGLSRTERFDDLVADSTNLSAGLSAGWEVDLWGRIDDQITASELNAAAAEADYIGARLSIAGQVAQTWFDLIEARLFTQLSINDVETQERALRLTSRRFTGGISGSSDVRLARSALAGAQALQASREQVKSSTARRLEVLLRRYPAELIEATQDLPPLPTLGGAGYPAEILAHRPDVIAAERRLQAAGLNVDVARKNMLPRLSLSADLDTGGSSVSDLFDIDSLVATFISGLTQPIFQGGRLKADVKQQEAFLRQNLEIYAGTVLDAYLEVENALDAERRLEQRENALRTSLEEARAGEQRLELRFSEGLASILELLDAQERRLSAESQLVSARAERFANRVRLHLALGGGNLGESPISVAQADNFR